jgi:ATP-dependent Clp protease adaptor protein ClpS
MSDESKTDHSGQTITREDVVPDTPRQYKVIIHNDDYTPMDFVVQILKEVFKKDEVAATQIMLHVHHQGKGICGVYSYEIAETKIVRVHELAAQYEYPLKASMEVE